MGSPLSPVVAQMVMENLEEKIISETSDCVKFIKRYIDDGILCVQKDKIKFIMNIFNNLRERIKFTYEKEINQKISFLDLEITHLADGKIKLDWYHKKNLVR